LLCCSRAGIVGTLVTGGDAGKLPDLRDVLSVSFKVRTTPTPPRYLPVSPVLPTHHLTNPLPFLLPQFMTKQDKKEGSSAASPHTDQLLSQVVLTILFSTSLFCLQQAR
jgi:hypothetical protein